MEPYNHTMDSRKNKHLNTFERGQIQLLLEDGLSVYAISKRLGRAYKTIRNEIRHGAIAQIKGEISLITISFHLRLSKKFPYNYLYLMHTCR